MKTELVKPSEMVYRRAGEILREGGLVAFPTETVYGLGANGLDENAVSQMKYEIANELGVNLGPDATARQNGTVGGEITRRLVSMAQSQLKSK